MERNYQPLPKNEKNQTIQQPTEKKNLGDAVPMETHPSLHTERFQPSVYSEEKKDESISSFVLISRKNEDATALPIRLVNREATPQVKLTVVLDLNPDQFTKDKEDLLLNAIAEFIKVDRSKLRTITIEPGSTRVDIEMPVKLGEEQLSKLKEVLDHVLSSTAPVIDVFTHLSHSILFFAAEPSDLAQLQILKEYRQVYAELRESGVHKEIPLRLSSGACLKHLIGDMLDYQPTIVHFAGHGSPDGLYFENKDRKGNSRVYSGESIGPIFEEFSSLRCVILNACYTATQATAIVQYVDRVIAIEHEIENDWAILFSSAFYQALAKGCSIDRAFSLSVKQIRAEGINSWNSILLKKEEVEHPKNLKDAFDLPIVTATLDKVLSTPVG